MRDGMDTGEDSASQSRLDAVILEYLEGLDRGTTLNRHEFIARYPDRAPELEEFFAAEGDLEKWKHDAAPVGASEIRASGLEPGVNVDDYEILGEIARGSMGTVYRARQKSLGREIALKVFHGVGTRTSVDIRRIRLEAEVAAALDHNSIVPVYEVGHTDGHDFIALKFIDGDNLAHHIDRYRGESKEIARILEIIARAAHFAHERGVLHRDLKPANILIDPAGEPHLTDFGLAKLFDHDEKLTLSDAILGTPKYMAPEQTTADSGDLTPAADVYSLGVILYELLTGEVPFRGDSALEILHRSRTEEPTPPSKLVLRIPADLETVCLKCLEKDSLLRYASSLELADDLGRYRRGEPILARRAMAFERFVKWTRRRPTLAALLALGVLAITAFIWLAARQRELERAEERRQYAADLILAIGYFELRDLDSASSTLARQIPS